MNTNFSYLLVALLIFIIGVPVASDLDLISLQMSRVLGASSLLAVGVWSLRGAGRLYSAGMLVAITGIVLSILSVVRESDMLHVIALLAMFVFLLLAMPAWNPDWIYFSFVTITTLGYGDITPLTQTARSLSFAEAIVGQFYIAVLVAGLVSAYISSKRDSSDRD